MVVQNSWFGRARNFPIFSPAWFRYRSAAFLISLLTFGLLLAALAALQLQPRDLDWPDVLQVSGVYYVPFVMMVMLGPGLATWVHGRAWRFPAELAAMLVLLLLSMAASFATFYDLESRYEKTMVDPVSGDQVRRFLPRFNLNWSRRVTHTTYSPEGTSSGGPQALYEAALAEVQRTAPRLIGKPAPARKPLTDQEHAAMNEYLRSLGANPPPTPAQQKANAAGQAAYEKLLRFNQDIIDHPPKPALTEPESMEYKAAMLKLNQAASELGRIAMVDMLKKQTQLSTTTETGLTSVAGGAGGVLLMLALLWLVCWLGGITDLIAFVRQRGKLDDALQAQNLRRASAARAEAELRLSVLAAQVEPHVLFNTLASMRSAIVSDQVRAAAIVDHLVDYLRATIPQMRHDAISSSVPLSSQLDAARAYLALMRERMPRLSFSVDAEPGLDAAQVPPLMLISLVENAVKHGVEPKLGPASIAVSARRTTMDETVLLELQVSDDGVGFGNATSGGGIGLANIQERLASLYGPQAGLALKALPDGGIAAILHLPLTFAPTD
jgi:hypothetical protein